MQILPETCYIVHTGACANAALLLLSSQCVMFKGINVNCSQFFLNRNVIQFIEFICLTL